MTIYTNLIEQTKKEIEEIEKKYNAIFRSLIIEDYNSPIERVIKLLTKQKALQLAEKMHLEFVEKLKSEIDCIDSEEFMGEYGFKAKSFKERIKKEINHLSDETQRKNNKDYDGFTIEPTQKGKEKGK